MEVEISTGRANFGDCPAHLKLLAVSAAVFVAQGIIQSVIKARHAIRPFIGIL